MFGPFRELAVPVNIWLCYLLNWMFPSFITANKIDKLGLRWLQMPPASGPVLNEGVAAVDQGDPAAPAPVGRTRARSSGLTVAGLQRADDQGQWDSDDSEMDRLYSSQLGRNSSRSAATPSDHALGQFTRPPAEHDSQSDNRSSKNQLLTNNV